MTLREAIESGIYEKDKEIERLNNIIKEALGIANERVNHYSNHKNNNEEHLEDWENIFDVLVERNNQELKGSDKTWEKEQK